MQTPLSDERREQIQSEIFVGRKIQAIKLYRAATGDGLKVAKDAVEAIEAELRAGDPTRFAKPASKRGCLAVAVVVLLIAAFFGAICGSLSLVNSRILGPLAVYESSQILNQYWQYKNEHGSWPPTGYVTGFRDSKFLHSNQGADGARVDTFSFDRSRHIDINLLWKDSLFASLISN